MKPTVSIVMATYNRLHLLRRSLCSYLDDRRGQVELIVVDDHSTDGTAEYLRRWSFMHAFPVTVVTPCPKEDSWRDCGAILNYGIRASQGEYVLLTHPEVIPGRKSIEYCVSALDAVTNAYACCRVYYLSPRDQENLDSVCWQDSALEVRNLPGFYDLTEGGNPDFHPTATDRIGTPGYRIQTWESWVFGGCLRSTWKRLGGMMETQEWGSVDVAFMQRRRALGMPNITCTDDESIVIHQNHDGPGNVLTDRNEAKWRKELKDVKWVPDQLVYPAIDNLGWD